MFSNKEKLGNFFFFFCILQPEFIVKAEKIYRIHWKKEAWRSLRADLGLAAWLPSAGDLVRQHARFIEDATSLYGPCTMEWLLLSLLGNSNTRL